MASSLKVALVGAIATTVLGSGALVTGATSARPDAPFVALASGHVGVDYSDHVADVFADVNPGVAWSNFHLVSGQLAPGLSVDPHTGAIKGTPRQPGVYDCRIEASGFVRRTFPFLAQTTALAPFSKGIGSIGIRGASAQVRASVAVFSADEHEIVAGQSFQAMGPYGVSQRTLSFTWTSSFDSKSRPATVVIYAPTTPIVRPFPFPPVAVLAKTTASPAPAPLAAPAAGARCVARPDVTDRDPSCAAPPAPAAAASPPVAAPAAQPATAVSRIVWPPRPPRARFPLIVHHRGRGFSHTDYDDLLSRIASWGIVIASVSDSESFYNPSEPQKAEWQYDGSRAELGMESASAAQEATMDFVLGLASTPGDALYGRIDEDAVFFEGHSRGGGATHASHVRSVPLRVKGVIYFMAYDLRNFANCAPPGVAPAYQIPTAQKRLPSLVIAAERDGDLVYPIADQFIDRATGPTTFVTVYGGCHDFLGDANTYDAYRATISRLDEQVRVADFVVAFVKRWSDGDISLDGFLYGAEHATSTTVGVASWRRASPTLVVDDFQDADAAHDLLGGDVGAIGLNRVEASIYPATGDMPRLGLKHSILAPVAQDSSFSLGLGGARCVRDHRALAMRIEQTGAKGWSVGVWARLTDASGQTTSVKVAKEDGSSTGYLPAWQTGAPSPTRFATLTIPLARLQQANPGFDLGAVTKIELVLHSPTATPDPAQRIVVDDVRFE